MNIRTDPTDFKPPRAGRWQGPIGLAVVVHVLLIAALTWGVNWKQASTPVFEAELWSPVAQQAAPREVEPPPPPPPRPPEPEPRPEPPPPPKAEPEPAKKAPDIAVEQEKKRKAAEEKARQEKADRDRRERERKAAEDKKRKDAEQKRQAEKKRQEEERRRAAEEKKLAEARKAAREDQMRRIQGLAGATGGPNATGTALRSSGPSSSYAGRVAAAIRPSIIYSEEFPATLRTEVEVRALANGSITDRRVVRSSGNRSWDEAALRAIDRTGSLPRDTDGRVPSPIVIVVRPQD